MLEVLFSFDPALLATFVVAGFLLNITPGADFVLQGGDVLTAQGEFGNFTNRAYYGTGPADTQPPRFVHVEQLGATVTNPTPPWVIRATIQDSMVDDGETSIESVTVSGGDDLLEANADQVRRWNQILDTD